MQSLAMLDAILEAEWDYRYYSFNAKWSETEEMGSMRNGSGDDLFALFTSSGAFLRGFDHESPMSSWLTTPPKVWPDVLEHVPAEFSGALNEPAFHMEDTTFCIWCLTRDSTWSKGSVAFPSGEDPDGSQRMLSELDGQPETYQAFAKDYFELDVEVKAIARVLAHEPLSAALLGAFPSSRRLLDLLPEAEEIGYAVVC